MDNEMTGQCMFCSCSLYHGCRAGCLWNAVGFSGDKRRDVMIGGPHSITMGCVIQDTVAQWGLNQRRGSRSRALGQETNREVPSEPELSGGGWKPE